MILKLTIHVNLSFLQLQVDEFLAEFVTALTAALKVRNKVVMAVNCTAGFHRSVFATLLAEAALDAVADKIMLRPYFVSLVPDHLRELIAVRSFMAEAFFEPKCFWETKA